MMLNFKKNDYACFSFTTNEDEVDIAEGNILEVDAESLVIAYNNVVGRATPTRVALNRIIDVF